MRRLEVRPGFSGWAQVNGRNAITWEQEFALDLWWVEDWSLWLDLRTVALTLWKTLKCARISQPGYATAHEFVGENTAQTSAGSIDEGT
jgi:lipopolysaccharide/colanic/teichoic acid biosynthesis glycosyltransferase